MKILITGSSGFIGNELVNRLSDTNEIVKFDMIQGNNILNYQDLTDAVKGCDVVVHIAAIPAPDAAKEFEDYFRINCQGTFNVAEACRENKVKRLIFTSSTTYYGIEKGIDFIKPVMEKNPVVTQYAKVEDLDCRPCDISYSTSKVICEQVLANYGLNKEFEVIILRIGPTRPQGVYRPFLGTHLKIENAIQALELAVHIKKTLWYEYFTITDELDLVDISKARKVLNYNPI